MALSPPGFVTRRNGRFMCNEKTFGAIGVNWFGGIEGPAGHGSNAMIDSAFDWMNDNGIRVARIMGFYNGTNPGGAAHQVTRGTFNSLQNGRRWFDGMDLTIKKATDYNVRLIIPLTNGTPSSFGGIDQWVQWGIDAGLFAGPVNDTTRDQFYTNSTIKTWLKAAYNSLITRVNGLTGVAYKDDPAILCWELANEPEQPDETPAGSSVPRWNAWREEMAAYIKSIDPNHLVGTGGTGFDDTGTGAGTPYSDATTAYNNQHWPFNGIKGISFSSEVEDPNIDMGSVHVYMAASHAMLDSQGPLYMVEKRAICLAAVKPMLVGEFGSTAASRASTVYDPWLDTILGFAPGACIAVIWDFMPSDDIQGPSAFTFEEPSIDQDDTDIKAVLAAAAATMNAANLYFTPTLTDISPTSIEAGTHGLTLVCTGTEFTSVSVVRWNGSDRVTQFVSLTELRATITEADLLSVDTVDITVFTPTPGGGETAAQTFEIEPPPLGHTLDALTPAAAPAGTLPLRIGVSGTGYTSSSVVRWNSVDRTTYFVSSTFLQADIPASDLAAPATPAVTVNTPGVGITAGVAFPIFRGGVTSAFRERVGRLGG